MIAHGRVGRVDRLPAGPRGAVDVDLQVVRVDLHVDVLGLGQHRDGRRRGVDASLGLGLRHALDAVRAALELEHRVGAVALDRERVLALADLQRLGLEAEALGVAGQHPVEVAGPQAGLLAAGAALDFDDHALLVVGVALDHRQADLLLELLDPLARARRAPRAARRPRPSPRAAPRRRPASSWARRHSRGELRGRLELAVGAADLGVALAVGDHLGVGHLLAELGEARLDLLDELFDHPGQSKWPGAPRREPLYAATPLRARPARAARRASPRAARGHRRRAAARPRRAPPRPAPIGSSRSTTRAPIVPSTLRVSACAQTAPNRPVLAPITAAGLPASGRGPHRARDPVERVLEHARDRARCTRASRRAPRPPRRSPPSAPRPPGASRAPRPRCTGGIAPSPSKSSSSTPRRQQLADTAQQARVVRVAPQAARDSEDAHRGYASLTSSSETSSLTSLSSAKPPFGSGAFQLEAELAPVDDRLELDADLLVAGDVLVRAGDACRARVTWCVWPLIVSSPSTSSSPPSPTRTARRAEADLRVAARVSKKSGDLRWPARFSSLTTIESTSTVPSSRGSPFSPTVSAPS